MYYFTEEEVLLAKSPKWEFEDYGFAPNGKGDCIWRTMLAAIAYRDSSYLDICAKLLKEGKRWPDSLNNVNDAENFLQKIRYPYLYRAQNSMTRDPYVSVFVASKILHQHQHFNNIKIPFYLTLFNRGLRNWKKYLELNKEKYKKQYEKCACRTLRLTGKRMPMYVKQLHAWKAFAIESDVVKKALLPYIPKWNYLLRILCNDHLGVDELIKVQEYKSKTGWQWQREEWHIPSLTNSKNEYYLDENEEFYLDKDILTWAIMY